MQQTNFPLFEQTKKGQSSLQTAAMSELLTQWLIDLKEQGLVSNDEVHQAAPEGKNLVGNRYIFNHLIWSETFDRPSEKGQQVWRSLPQLEE